MDFTVESVDTYWPNANMECWAVLMTRPDGTGHAYVFPKFTLEQRAAEYGFDPTDIDTLLDVVLHEQFVHSPGGPDTEDAAARQGMLSPALTSSGIARKGQMVPTDLFNAPTIKDARDAHLARIAHAKTKGRVRPPAKGPDPLDRIRAEHGVTAAGVAARARVVDLNRRAMRGQLTQDEARQLSGAGTGVPSA